MMANSNNNTIYMILYNIQGNPYMPSVVLIHGKCILSVNFITLIKIVGAHNNQTFYRGTDPKLGALLKNRNNG